MATAARMVIVPPVVSNRKNMTEPRIDYLFSFPDLYHGAKVRLVVYHLDMYGRNPLCKQEGPSFFKFKQGDLTRVSLDSAKVDARWGSEANPKMGTETGVLLKLEGTLLKSSKVKGGGGWWFGLRGTPEENTSKPYSVLRLHMATSEEDAVSFRVNSKPVARIILLDDTFQNMYTDHRLVFRMALTSAHATLKEGAVIAASLCPEDNPACPPEPKTNPQNKGVVVFDAAAVKLGKPHPIGGDGGAAALPPTPSPRVLSFDLTGFYEHVNGAKDPALMLHLSQAGHALVGWFSIPTPVLSQYSPGTIAGLPTTPGCIWVSSLEAADKTRGYQFFWFAQAAGGYNQTDPDAIVPQTNGAPGWIKPTKDPNNADVDAVELTFEHNDGASSPALTLRKIKGGARWPWAVIGDPAYFSAEERELLIADQVRPVATAAWERIRKEMSPKTVLEKGPPEATIQSVIEDWANTQNSAARSGHRAKISSHLDHLMSPFTGLAGDYRHRAALQIKAAAATYKITVGTVTDTVFGWIQLMVSQYLTDLADKRDAGVEDFKGKTDAELYAKLESGFKNAEFGPEGKYIYTMKFAKKAGLPDKMPVVRGYWFTVTINKEVEKKDKTRAQDVEWSNHGWAQKELHGVFVATGVGAGINVDGSTVKGKASKGGSLPGNGEFHSFSSVTLPDFDGATFSVVALSGPGGSVGPISGKSASSMIQFTLKSGATMTCIIEDVGGKVDPGSKSIGGSLFDLSGGFGKLLTDIPSAAAPPDDSSDDIDRQKDAKTAVFVLFKRDSAVLEQRNYFERRLAMNRAMFETGEPKAKVLGYASPEASKEHNLDLSVRRATAVKLAVLDAFVPDMALTSFDAVGLGEEPSIKKGGLLDPPGKTKEEKVRVHEEELTKYSIWRAVDVWIQGSLVVRARPKEEEKGKP